MAAPFSVRGRSCLVTGASTGLGAGFARTLIAGGAHVVNLSRDTPDWPGGQAAGAFVDLRGDVRCEADVRAAIEATVARFGRLDVVVNNAGAFHRAKAARQDETALAELIDTNVTAVARVCRLAHAAMRGQGGSIVNVTSVLGRAPMKGLSAYGASKAALEQMTRAMALEWAGDGVRVNALAPGWYRTAMTSAYLDEGLGAILARQIPLRRLGEPDDLAGPLLLLASDASRYMTGVTVTVDGGYSVRA